MKNLTIISSLIFLFAASFTFSQEKSEKLTLQKEELSIKKPAALADTASEASQVQIPENSKGVKPMVIIDGKEVNQFELEKLDPNSIKEMHVLKDENATKIYGEKGKNGVILITLKD